ncbi:hypothetical protein AMTRI_Chr13g125920 [Amborella trichopoda]
MDTELSMKNETSKDSPISVLEDEGLCTGEVNLACEGDAITSLYAKFGDTTLISEAMVKEEADLHKARESEENEEKNKSREPGESSLSSSKFSKLDELLTQTQLYTNFLFEKMDDITFNGAVTTTVETASSGKGGRGKKRKKATTCNTNKARKAVNCMLARSQDENGDESQLTNEAKAEKEAQAAREQAEIAPLLTGGKLKTYQVTGVKWMISLWQNGLNGILADQMGLGKTIQTIGLLTHLKGKGLDGPYMIIAPLSTLSNWVNEFSRFAPSIKAMVYHGDKDERLQFRKNHMPRSIGPDFPIIVTSYEIAMNDSKFLSHFTWKYVVVDEGHRLKNMNCKLLRELKRIPIENKLLLTGTPLQNNLAELWSLLHFILPDIFSSCEEFQSWFDWSGKSNDETQHEESDDKWRVHVISKLHMILRPFLLRRVKENVEQNLPKKKEIILYANMTEHQKNIQNHLINKTLEGYLIEKAFRAKGFRAKLSNLMIQLRKNCNHPDLLESAFDNDVFYPPVEKLLEQCGKFRLLDRILSHLLARRHKVLIFSQWTKVLDIIEYFLSEKGLNTCRIDGSIKLAERQQQIKEFNDLDSQWSIFLLSTRAGGLGINLTAADTCVIYDSDWNPQIDLQAMDRCHRIGQTKPVHVYRLATSHSVEGRMLKRASAKLKLENLVIEKGQFQQERTKPAVLPDEDLLALLKEEEDEEDKLVQTDISEEDLLRVLDRSDMVDTPENNDAKSTIPLRGPGWEVVAKQVGSMLSSFGDNTKQASS